MNRNLTMIYHHEIPSMMQEFAQTPEMLRLKDAGMDCGCEYTQYPIFQNIRSYSRYDHSIGVANIAYHFSCDPKVAIAALFHDIATPAFSHVIDFVHHDYTKQEATENQTRVIIEKSKDIQTLLKKYHLTTDDVCDYHIYPIADNDSPKLSSDRLEYTLTNCQRYLHRTDEEIMCYYNDLIVGENEFGEQEIMFQNADIACQFTKDALDTCKIYCSDADRYIMERLAQILRLAFQKNVLTEHDLYKSEKEVITKFCEDATCQSMWKSLTRMNAVKRRDTKPNDDGWVNVDAKKRYINPYVKGIGRVSTANKEIAQMILEYLAYDFTQFWIKGYTK